MSNPYKRAAEKIPVPPALIEKTALAARQKPARRAPVVYLLPAAAVTAAAALLLFFAGLPPRTPDYIVTKLTDGQFAQQVELTDGTLYFQQSAFTVPPPYLSGPGVQKENWTAEQYGEHLGVDVTPGELPPGLVLARETVAVYTRGGAIFSEYYAARYESENGGWLDVTVSKGRLPPQRVANLAETSEIGGSPLAVTADTDTGVYGAQFLYNGVGYRLESGNISQEAFIRVLHSFFE